MTRHDICGVLALCDVVFEVLVTNVDPPRTGRSTAHIVSETREPVALAYVGGRGKLHPRMGKAINLSPSIRISVSGANVMGSVRRVTDVSQFHTGGGYYHPVFLMSKSGGGSSGSGHTCILQGEKKGEEDSTLWDALGFIVFSAVVFLIVVLTYKRRPTIDQL